MTTIEQFREHLAAVDPATLTREDRLALLALFEKTIPDSVDTVRITQ